MSVQTIRKTLGQLQDDPDNEAAWEELSGALADVAPEEVAKFFAAARQAHMARREWDAVASLLEIAVDFAKETDAQRPVLIELARVYDEELFDDERAEKAYKRILELAPGDPLAEEAVERIEAKRKKWEELVDRYVDEAKGSADPAFRASLLVSGAEVAYRYGRPQTQGKKKLATLMSEITTGLTEALEIDPKNRKASALLERIYRDTQRWEELGHVLERMAGELPSKEEKVAAWVRFARVLSKKLKSPERAAAAYERVIDLQPGHPEATSALVDFFTQKEMWDHLVSLYDEQLAIAQRTGHADPGAIIQIAMVHWRMRGKPDAAEPYFEKLRRIEPAHPGMLDFFRQLLKEKGDTQRLSQILTDASRALPEGPQRAAIGAEIAKLAEEGANATKAIEQWRAILRQDANNNDAREALKRLYRQSANWNSLADLLRTELDKLPADDKGRIAILREIAAIYRDHVKSDSALVTVLTQISTLDPKDIDAVRELVRVYEALQRWRDLLTAQSRLADLETDKGTKAELHRMVARRWLDQFSNVQNAVEAYEKLYEAAPGDPEASQKLKELYGKRRTYNKLYEQLEREAAQLSEGPERREMWLEMAKLAAERLDRGADAVRLYKKVIEEDPGAAAALDALEKQAERDKDWATVAEVLERRAAHAPDDPTRLNVLQKLGAVYAERLKDHAGAMKVWKRVLELQPGHAKALRVLRDTYLATNDFDGLTELYGSASDWEGLAEVLSNAADRSTDQRLKIELSFRAAEVFEQKIKEPERAFRAYERVLSVHPNDKRAAEALIPIYEKEEKWTRLPALYDILLAQEEETSEKLALLRKLMHLVGERLGDKAAAFNYAKTAYELVPEDERALADVERCAGEASQWAELVKVLEARAMAASASEGRSLRGKIADIQGRHLGKEDDAVAIRKQLVLDDEKDEAAMAALDALLRASERRDDLRWLFDLRVQRAKTAQKIDLLLDWATLEEEVWSEPRKAIDIYQRILEHVPQHGRALRSLSRLLHGVGDAEKAAEVLERDRDQREGPERAAREVELARLYLESLKKPQSAFDAAKRALDLVPGMRDAAAVMEDLLKVPETRGKAASVLDDHFERAGEEARRPEVIEVLVATARSKEDRLGLFKKLAEVHEKLGAAKTAFDVIARAVDEAPSELDLWDRLAVLANKTNRTQAFVESVARAIPDDRESGLPEAVELDLCERAATLYEEGLGDAQRARPYLERILGKDPSNERAFARLKQILTSLERWDDLESTYERAIGASTPQRQVELLAEIALVAEEITQNPERAMAHYERLLSIDGAHDHAARALDSLYVAAQRWEPLAKLLEKRLEGALGDREALHARLGALYFEKLERAETALGHLEQVLAGDPTSKDARDIVEKCLALPDLRARAAQTLETVYAGSSQNRDLVRILEIRLETAGDADKVDLLRRIAEIRDERLNEDSAALDAYSRLVPLAPEETHARTRLLDLARRLGAHEQAAKTLEEAAKTAPSPQPKAEILGAVAKIYEDLLDDSARAESIHRQVLEVAPEDPDIALPAARSLERIYAAAGKTRELADMLRVQVKLEADPARDKELYGRLGEICETNLDDAKGAIEAWKARVEMEPDDLEALAALDRLYERTGEHRALVEILRARERLTTGGDERKQFLQRIAVTLADKLTEVTEAIQAYRTILDDFGADKETLESLAKLYEIADRYEDLAETLETSIGITEVGDAQLDLYARLAQVRQQRLKDIPGAIEACRQALTIQPSHGPSRARLEELLGDSEAKREAGQILRPLYEADGEHEKLLRVLEIEVDSEDGMDAKLGVLSQAVMVTEQSLNDPARAFAYSARALQIAAGEPEIVQWLERTERLAAAASKWRELTELLQNVVPNVLDESVQVDIYVKIAELARTKLENAELAKEHYKKALEIRADESRALVALEELYAQSSENESLLDILKRRAEATDDASERKKILFKEARLCDETLHDTRAAIEVYEQILDIDPDDDALSALERLYASSQRWDDLVALLERQIGMDFPSDRKARLHHTLGVVLKDRIQDWDRAFDQFQAALELENKHAATVSTLEEIVKLDADPLMAPHVSRAAEMLEPVYLASLDWKHMLPTLEARLRVSQDPDERRQLLKRLAKLHEEQAEDYKSALETTAKLLAEDITLEETWDELERLARVAGDEGRLAEIYATELAKITSDEPATAKLSQRAAELFEKQRDTQRALEFYRRAYAFAPEESTGAFEAIDRLLRELALPKDRVALYQDALSYRNDPKDRLTTLHTIALLQEAEIHDDDAAIETYRAALDLDDTDQHSLEALSRLYGRRERWSDLAELTRRRAEQAALPEDEARFRLELGNLLKDRLNDRSGAVDEYQAVVEILPAGSGATAPTQAVKALEELLTDESLKARVVEILRPIYERADAWQKLVVVGEQRLALAQDPQERAGVLKEIARLWEDRGGDANKAFDCIRDAYTLDPDDGETRNELDRLGTATARWDDLATTYEKAIERIDDIGKRELLAALARLHDQKRDDPRNALRAWERLFETDETELEPLEPMDLLATLLADWPTLVRVLSKKADLVNDDSERARILRRLGEVKRDMTADEQGAIEAFERALELEPDSAESLDKLITLYEAKDDASRLVDLYRRRVDLCQSGEEDRKYELLLLAADRYEKGLQERREAIQLLGDALVVRPGDAVVTTRLDALYTAEAMWPELLENLRLQAAGEGDDAKRRLLKKRIGKLLVTELEDARSALDSFREVLEGGFDEEVLASMRDIGDKRDELRLEVADVLEPVLRSAERHQDLVAILEMRLSAQTEPSDRGKTLHALADVYDAKLSDAKGAEDALLRALAEEPGDAALHADIERIADRLGEDGWNRYAATLTERAASIFDAHVTSDLYIRLGKVCEEKLKDDVRAAKAYREAAQQSGDSPEVLVSLDRVSSRLGDPKSLAEVLERRIAVEAQASVQADLHHRLATLQIREFGERSQGLQTLRAALERVPDHEASRQAIEQLLEESTLFDEAFEALEWVYRTLARTEDLAKLYERKVSRADGPRDRNRARLDLARVLDEQAHDAPRAQRVVEEAIVEDPQDADALAELERLAPVTNGWKEAGDALARALDQAKDLPPQARAELWVRVAGWRRDKEQDAQKAEAAFAKALESEPENVDVLRALEELRRAPGRERDLVDTLRQRAKVETDLQTKRDLLKEAKSLAEGTINDAALAEAVLRDLLAEDEGDLWALEELTRLREQAGQPEDVVKLLLRRAELEADGAEIARLRHRAAKVLSEQVGDHGRAIELYEAIFDAEPSDKDAQDALRSLYAKEKRNGDLAKLLERLIEIAESDSARSALRIDLAKLQDSLGQAEDAISTLRRVLEDDPSHKDAVVALSELYERGGKDEELAELLGSQINQAESRGDSEVELALKVRLGEVYENRLKDAQRALTTYEAVLARDSAHRGALEAVARLSEGRGSWERAATALAKLTEISEGEDRIALCMRLADARTKLSDSEGVEEALKRALAVQASNADVRERLRALYEKEKNWKGLADLLVGDADLIRDAHLGNGNGNGDAPSPIATTPPRSSIAPAATVPPPPAHVADQVKLLRRAAEIHLKERKVPADAAVLLERASDLVPQDRELLLALCDAYSASGRDRDATQVLEKVIASFGGKRTKELALYHHKLAKALSSLGERDQALNQLDLAFKIDPRSIEVLKDLGVLAFETNDLDRATKTFKALLLQKLEPTVGITKGEVFYYLGEISAKQGDKTRAVQMLERALESDPSLDRAKSRLAELKS